MQFQITAVEVSSFLSVGSAVVGFAVMREVRSVVSQTERSELHRALRGFSWRRRPDTHLPDWRLGGHRIRWGLRG